MSHYEPVLNQLLYEGIPAIIAAAPWAWQAERRAMRVRTRIDWAIAHALRWQALEDPWHAFGGAVGSA